MRGPRGEQTRENDGFVAVSEAVEGQDGHRGGAAGERGDLSERGGSWGIGGR